MRSEEGGRPRSAGWPGQSAGCSRSFLPHEPAGRQTRAPREAKGQPCPWSMSGPAGPLFSSAFTDQTHSRARAASGPSSGDLPWQRLLSCLDFSQENRLFLSFQGTFVFSQASGDHICLGGERGRLFPVSPRHCCMQSGILGTTSRGSELALLWGTGVGPGGDGPLRLSSRRMSGWLLSST